MQRDFTPDGQVIYEVIDDFSNRYKKGFRGAPPSPPSSDSKVKREFDSVKMEIVKMVINSTMVVEDCDLILAELETPEDYIKSDARVAKRLHEGLIVRLTRILQGLPAFEDETHLTLSINDIKTALTSKKY